MVSDYSSLHGVPWYNRMDNVVLKTVLFILIMLIVIGLPGVVVYAFIAFLNDDTMTDAVLWTNAKAMRYPNFTVCNAGFFDVGRMEGWY